MRLARRGGFYMARGRQRLDLLVKRVYAPAAPDDGVRILVDRLWPRGLKKEAAAVDRWLKDLAPSAELRRWFGHDPARWDEFRERYARELEGQPALLDELRALARHGRVTLLFGAHDERHNNAAALREMLLGRSDPNSAAAGTNPRNAPNIKRPTSVR